jgi:hypothetical protein
MTNRERILNTLNKRPADRVPYAARFDQWYNRHFIKGTLPERYKHSDAYDIIRDIRAGIRPARYYKQNKPIARVPSSRLTGLFTEALEKIDATLRREGNTFITEIQTPTGPLRMVESFSDEAEGSSSIETKHFFKSPADYPKLKCFGTGIGRGRRTLFDGGDIPHSPPH